jgi:predicted glycogen debranching enzyme
MNFEKDQNWWFNFVYRCDRQRGQDFIEDLWTPGFYKCDINSPTKIIFRANIDKQGTADELANISLKEVCAELQRHQNSVIAGAKTKDKQMRTLCLAADQFVCKRQTAQSERTTILAGFPWFVDWGRDAFISLPGLLLSTSKFNDARSVLNTFAAAADEGMIPNRFDDNSDTAYFNSIDTSLWFIEAAFQYLNAVGDGKTFTENLLPVIRLIIDAYQNGTRFGISADSDGLITGGNEETQLTWMDAKHGGVAFTPRYGKTVEVNALWYNGLRWLAEFYATKDIEEAKHFDFMAERVANSFRQLFRRAGNRHLNLLSR